jgi:hypothetical protein
MIIMQKEINLKYIQKAILTTLTLVLVFSCNEKTTIIGGVVKEKYTGKPISGIVVGLYDFVKDTNVCNLMVAQWADFKLIDEAITDADGRFLMEVDQSLELGIKHYFLRPSSDTLSKNCKYTFSTSDYTYGVPDWGKNINLKLPFSANILINVLTIKSGDSIKVVNNNNSYILPYDGIPTNNCFELEPGMSHSFSFYRRVAGLDVFIESQEFYVKCIPTEETGKLIKEISVQQIDVELINY